MSRAKVYPAIGGTVLAALLLGIIATNTVNAEPQAVPSSMSVVAYETSCVLDAKGYCKVPHGLGVRPVAVTVQAASPGHLVNVDPRLTTDTTYTARFLWRTGVTFAAGTTVRYTVTFVYEVPATTPTPSPSPSASPTPTVTPSPTQTPPATGERCTDPVWSSSLPKANWSGADQSLVVNNEVWNATQAGPQTIHVCDYNSWYVVSNQPKPGADQHSIKSYPDTQKLYSNPTLGSVASMVSTWVHEAPAVGEWNFAYDIWMNNWNTELMVWTQHTYPGKLPPGDAQETATVTIDGTSYKAWRRDNGNYIALVADQQKAAGSVDLLKVFQWLISKDWLKTTTTLQAVDYGVEIANTGGGPQTFRLNDYTLTTRLR